MQKQFKYIYNGKEVDREAFEKLSEGNFKWFSEQGIESVPFSSFDNFFNGEFKSGRQINDHLDSVLNVYQNKVTKDIINKSKCSPQCYCDGSCKKSRQKDTNSTRHKSQNGETHKEKDDVITNSNISINISHDSHTNIILFNKMSCCKFTNITSLIITNSNISINTSLLEEIL